MCVSSWADHDYPGRDFGTVRDILIGPILGRTTPGYLWIPYVELMVIGE
jgi:hypothetical protein